MIDPALLEQYNPWWQGKPIPKIYRFDRTREQFSLLKKQAGNIKLASAVVGPRRIGKTILLYQLIDRLIKQRDPKRVIFLKADDPAITVEENVVADLIQTIEKILTHKQISELNSPIFIILDEIQAVPKWAEYIKKYLDLGWPVKFIVSGSAAINIVKTTKESLAGRAAEIILGPMGFRECFNWLGNRLTPISGDELLTGKMFWRRANDLWKKFSAGQRRPADLFENFLTLGGFPEIVYRYFVTGRPYQQLEISAYLKDQVIERVLFRDIPELTGLKNTYFLQQLFTLLSKESGSVFNLREISRKFAVSFQTVQAHLWYLHQAYLISLIRKYSRGGMSQARTQPKIHLTDTGVIASLNNLGREVLTDRVLAGKLAESATASGLRFSPAADEIFFYRDQKGEVDLMLAKGKTVIPIEVKFRRQAVNERYDYLVSIADRFRAPYQVVITQTEFERRNGLFFLPAWLFNLLV